MRYGGKSKWTKEDRSFALMLSLITSWIGLGVMLLELIFNINTTKEDEEANW